MRRVCVFEFKESPNHDALRRGSEHAVGLADLIGRDESRGIGEQSVDSSFPEGMHVLMIGRIPRIEGACAG